jgi:dolichol-phosphate mannosyltransferase
MPSISVCVPVFNEEDNIEHLVSRVGGVLGSIGVATSGKPHEIVFVDDGSTDRTAVLLEAHVRRGHSFRVSLVRFSRNFGHQIALTAALDHAGGDVCFLIDGDLQDRPEELERFVAEYRAGADVVYARRIKRKESWWLRLSYRFFYRMARMLSEEPLPLDAGDFSLVSRRVVEVMKAAPERNRYLRGLRSWAGFQQMEIPVERAARNAGESKYGIWKLFKLACDGIFSFSVMPLRFAAIIGALTLGGAILFSGYALYARLFLGVSPPGFTALTFLLVTFSGIQLLFMGIIGEYVGRIYQEAKRRPQYVVDEVLESE